VPAHYGCSVPTLWRVRTSRRGFTHSSYAGAAAPRQDSEAEVGDVIERVLNVEEEARRIVAEAEQEAQAILDRAHAEAQQIESAARERARREADDLLSAKARVLEEQRQKAIREEQQRLPSVEGIAPARLEEAVRFAVGVVAGEAAASGEADKVT
jgi:vacuolar-type H+-ATPase subunit H